MSWKKKKNLHKVVKNTFHQNTDLSIPFCNDLRWRTWRTLTAFLTCCWGLGFNHKKICKIMGEHFSPQHLKSMRNIVCTFFPQSPGRPVLPLGPASPGKPWKEMGDAEGSSAAILRKCIRSISLLFTSLITITRCLLNWRPGLPGQTDRAEPNDPGPALPGGPYRSPSTGTSLAPTGP